MLSSDEDSTGIMFRQVVMNTVLDLDLMWLGIINLMSKTQLEHMVWFLAKKPHISRVVSKQVAKQSLGFLPKNKVEVKKSNKEASDLTDGFENHV